MYKKFPRKIYKNLLKVIAFRGGDERKELTFLYLFVLLRISKHLDANHFILD